MTESPMVALTCKIELDSKIRMSRLNFSFHLYIRVPSSLLPPLLLSSFLLVCFFLSTKYHTHTGLVYRAHESLPSSPSL